MLGNGLTLSTDNGEQAGEENDRMAAHHLFSPSLPPRGFFRTAIARPSSSSSTVFHVSCHTRREVRFAHATKKRTHCYYSDSSSPFGRPRCRRSLSRRCVRRSLDDISTEPLAIGSPFNVTKDSTFRTHITSLPSLLLLREEPTNQPARVRSRVSATRRKTRFTYAYHVIRSLMTADRSRDRSMTCHSLVLEIDRRAVRFFATTKATRLSARLQDFKVSKGLLLLSASALGQRKPRTGGRK
jgi:hypothetical protein